MLKFIFSHFSINILCGHVSQFPSFDANWIQAYNSFAVFYFAKAFLLFFLTIQDFMGFEDGPKNHVMKNFMF